MRQRARSASSRGGEAWSAFSPAAAAAAGSESLIFSPIKMAVSTARWRTCASSTSEVASSMDSADGHASSHPAPASVRRPARQSRVLCGTCPAARHRACRAGGQSADNRAVRASCRRCRWTRSCRACGAASAVIHSPSTRVPTSCSSRHRLVQPRQSSRAPRAAHCTEDSQQSSLVCRRGTVHRCRKLCGGRLAIGHPDAGRFAAPCRQLPRRMRSWDH